MKETAPKQQEGNLCPNCLLLQKGIAKHDFESADNCAGSPKMDEETGSADSARVVHGDERLEMAENPDGEGRSAPDELGEEDATKQAAPDIHTTTETLDSVEDLAGLRPDDPAIDESAGELPTTESKYVETQTPSSETGTNGDGKEG